MQFKEPKGIVLKSTITAYANPKIINEEGSKKG